MGSFTKIWENKDTFLDKEWFTTSQELGSLKYSEYQTPFSLFQSTEVPEMDQLLGKMFATDGELELELGQQPKRWEELTPQQQQFYLALSKTIVPSRTPKFTGTITDLAVKLRSEEMVRNLLQIGARFYPRHLVSAMMGWRLDCKGSKSLPVMILCAMNHVQVDKCLKTRPVVKKGMTDNKFLSHFRYCFFTLAVQQEVSTFESLHDQYKFKYTLTEMSLAFKYHNAKVVAFLMEKGIPTKYPKDNWRVIDVFKDAFVGYFVNSKTPCDDELTLLHHKFWESLSKEMTDRKITIPIKILRLFVAVTSDMTLLKSVLRHSPPIKDGTPEVAVTDKRVVLKEEKIAFFLDWLAKAPKRLEQFSAHLAAPVEEVPTEVTPEDF